MQSVKLPSATSSSSVADILERVLDMGVVIAGDIKIKLVEVELLTIQIRLVICSIEKAKEIGMDWWNVSLNKNTSPPAIAENQDAGELARKLEAMEKKLQTLEKSRGAVR